MIPYSGVSAMGGSIADHLGNKQFQASCTWPGTALGVWNAMRHDHLLFQSPVLADRHPVSPKTGGNLLKVTQVYGRAGLEYRAPGPRQMPFMP